MDITLTFQAPELDNKDLQAEVDQLLPQIREIEGDQPVQMKDCQNTSGSFGMNIVII